MTIQQPVCARSTTCRDCLRPGVLLARAVCVALVPPTVSRMGDQGRVNYAGGSSAVHLYQDGVGWHGSPPVQEKMQALNIVWLGKPPARSPDLNCIENLFGFGDKRLGELWLKKKPTDAAETEERFHDICTKAAASGEILHLVESLPRRMQGVIDAEGGPVAY